MKFLDDQLYDYVVEIDMENKNEIFVKITNIYGICYKFIKNKIGSKKLTTKQVKAILDQAFVSWNLFVERIKKDQPDKYDCLLSGLKSYKKAFMSKEGAKEFYNNL